MATKTDTREIDGMQFMVTGLPAWQSMKMLTRIGRILGPSLAKMVGSKRVGASIMDIELDGAQIGQAVELLFEKLTEAELESISKKLLENSFVDPGDGKGLRPLLPVFDDVMAGKTFTIFKLLKFAFEVNYSDFSDAAEGIARLQAALKAAPQSPASPTK